MTKKQKTAVAERDEAKDETAEKEPITACPGCGARLVNIMAGALCPKGCGGVYPKVTSEQNR